MNEERIVNMAIDFANKRNFGYITPREALVSFARKLADRYYLVSQEEAERIYQNLNEYPDGWTSDADVMSILEDLIPELNKD